jgi:hypothetical protein
MKLKQIVNLYDAIHVKGYLMKTGGGKSDAQTDCNLIWLAYHHGSQFQQKADQEILDKIIDKLRETVTQEPLCDGYVKDGHKVFSQAQNTEIKYARDLLYILEQEILGDTIEDGHGGFWSSVCPECGEKAMHIVRPGKVQCSNCG